MVLTYIMSADVIDGFTTPFINVYEKTAKELCSFCNVQWYQMMQSSPYSDYSRGYESLFEHVNSVCGLNLPTAIFNRILFENPYVEWDRYCSTGLLYKTSAGDTCNSIAAQFKVASAAIRSAFFSPIDCFAIPAGKSLCIPRKCDTYTLKDGDTCESIE